MSIFEWPFYIAVDLGRKATKQTNKQTGFTSTKYLFLTLADLNTGFFKQLASFDRHAHACLRMINTHAKV